MSEQLKLDYDQFKNDQLYIKENEILEELNEENFNILKIFENQQNLIELSKSY